VTALIAGAFEHPARELPGVSVAQVHAEVARGALADAGLEMGDVDAYFCAQDAPGFGGLSMADYLGLHPRFIDTTEAGGASYLSHVGHAAAAIRAGKCSVALITLGGTPRSGGARHGANMRGPEAPEAAFESPYGASVVSLYALAARRHMYEYGTTARQLAQVKVTASEHAAHNERALLRAPVTIDEVLESPMISDPLHRLDCCVVTDGGGALVVVAPEVARHLARPTVRILGHGEAVATTSDGRVDLTRTAAARSGPAAFAEAGVRPADIDYASIYDSFTITVIESIEDLGFCKKGEGGPFVGAGALRAPDGALPVNTDGGGLCNNHPANRGGTTKIVEAVRQLRGEANAELQVPDCELALVHGLGGVVGSRSAGVTLILGRDE
jgi:acetyl-CoA C-acetyltransferase